MCTSVTRVGTRGLGTEMSGLPGRRLMLVYYAVTAMVGMATLWGDAGQTVVEAFGGRGLALGLFGGGYVIFGVFGVVSRMTCSVRSERVAVTAITASA